MAANMIRQNQTILTCSALPTFSHFYPSNRSQRADYFNDILCPLSSTSSLPPFSPPFCPFSAPLPGSLSHPLYFPCLLVPSVFSLFLWLGAYRSGSAASGLTLRTSRATLDLLSLANNHTIYPLHQFIYRK